MSILRTHSKPKTHISIYPIAGGPAAMQSFGWQNGQPILRPLPFRTFRGEILAASANRGAAVQRPTSSSLRSVPIASPRTMSAESFSHQPVMVDEIIELFKTVPAGWVVDATLGGAGHTRAILNACPQLCVIGIDQDKDAIRAASARLATYGDRARVVRARFDELAQVLSNQGIESASGVLFDLGVSSHQFDTAERGFSYRTEAPLDMRMDTSAGRSASAVVNEYEVADLERIIREHSDERFAGRIARAIVAARPVRTTTELAAIVASAIPAPARRRGGNPAKRTFQALRIEVNAELEILEPALLQAVDSLTPGGRIAVLSYHSGEDRIAKSVLRAAESGGCTCPVGLPCGCGAMPTLKRVRVAAKASTHEQKENPRSTSARLRAAEKLMKAQGL